MATLDMDLSPRSRQTLQAIPIHPAQRAVLMTAFVIALAHGLETSLGCWFLSLKPEDSEYARESRRLSWKKYMKIMRCRSNAL